MEVDELWDIMQIANNTDARVAVSIREAGTVTAAVDLSHVLRTISKDNLTIQPMNVQATGARLAMAIANLSNAEWDQTPACTTANADTIAVTADGTAIPRKPGVHIQMISA